MTLRKKKKLLNYSKSINTATGNSTKTSTTNGDGWVLDNLLLCDFTTFLSRDKKVRDTTKLSIRFFAERQKATVLKIKKLIIH